jgi:hypothetical protein
MITLGMFMSPENWSENEHWTSFMKENKVLDIFEIFGKFVLKSYSKELIEKNIEAGLSYCKIDDLEVLKKFIEYKLVNKKCFKLKFWMVVSSQTENKKLELVINDNSFQFKYFNDDEVFNWAEGDFTRIEKPIIKQTWSVILKSMLRTKFPDFTKKQDDKEIQPYVHVMEMEFREGYGTKPLIF